MSRIVSYYERHLEPSEFWGAVLFGLIMAMIFTLGGRSIVSEGRDATRDMLLGVVGCNVAWGLIQGWMFILDAMFERSRIAQLVKEVQEEKDQELALAAVRDELDSTLAEITSGEERARLYQHILGNMKRADTSKTRMKRDDLAGAFGVFVLVSLTALPAILPFLFIENLRTALRVSNLLQVSLLFFVGYRWASVTNANKWLAGLVVMLVGVVMAVIGEVLGG